ncbi:Lysyl-tRNA synthetase class II [Klebsormidium nitens]|uniref:Lysine--tRNA ligase n=1 Tax=Klebsormidium nitens TaxID=105231 RepID=A0A0U9HKL7_KLENI|nr:Lysyl-tRNA synthetase class II [Klebsormidium nitens]|eukprot:GAQ90046.1 Lysyl-tRNA synthetase class II [Klebsormidium nitens]
MSNQVRCNATEAEQVAAPQVTGQKKKKGGQGGAGAPPGKKKKEVVEQLDTTSSLEDIRTLRVAKVEELRAGGHNPFAYTWQRSHSCAELQQLYKELPAGELAEGEEDQVAVAGRIMAKRTFGKLAFLTMRDSTGEIQLYVEKARVDETAFGWLKGGLLDVGDIVGAKGTLKRTDKGELSVHATSLAVLTKSLLPLPDKFHGLTDVEKRYRQRYLDMIVNPEVGDVFRSRAKVLSTIRRYLEDRGFLDIETPVLQTAAGGAEARPFITFHNALGQRMFLRIATELHLKRMVVGGLDRVFEIGRIFRNEGVSTRHNPEFTSVEVYQAYADYFDMMDLIEEMVTACALAVRHTLTFDYQGTPLDFTRPWRRATMHDLVKEATGVDFDSFAGDVEAARAAALDAVAAAGGNARSPALRNATSIGFILNEVFEEVVEKTLVQPTYVTEHPVEISPLAKPHRSKPGVTERFELFIYGRELANAFSELTDPVDQRARLEAQVAAHTNRTEAELAAATSEEAIRAAQEDAYDVALDEDFLTALEYGMPPTAGMGLGIDRLVMLLTDSASIRDVIAFPVLKNH